MNFQEFADYVLGHMLDGWKEDADVSLHKIKKNNGVIYTDLSIREGDGTVAPAIYLEEYYEAYEKGTDPDQIILEIRRRYEWSMSRIFLFDQDISDYKRIRDKLIYRLVSFDRNKDLLQSCPHIRLDDLAITFRWLAHEDSVGISSALVSWQEMEMWGVSIQDIILDAHRNTERIFPGKIMAMEEFLQNISAALPMPGGGIPMYIVTNVRMVNGASSILYEGFLRRFAKDHPGNFYIIPSSIHEVVLVPEDMVEEPDHLASVISQANEAVVQPEEVLSDSLYYYDADQDSISLYQPD